MECDSLGSGGFGFKLCEGSGSATSIDRDQAKRRGRDGTRSVRGDRGAYLGEHVWRGLHLDELAGAALDSSKLRTREMKRSQKQPPHPPGKRKVEAAVADACAGAVDVDVAR